MKYAADGTFPLTIVSGTSPTGLFNADGSMNAVFSPGNKPVGFYHPCGAAYVTVGSGPGAYAPDGSLYAMTSGAGYALYKNLGISTTSIPAVGSLVARFSADSLALANGANVTSWTDSISGIVAGTAVGTGPTFATNRVNGKPSVSFGGGGGLSIATPGALKTAVDSQDYTVFIVFKSLGAAPSGFGALVSATAGGGSFFYNADGTNVQRYAGTVFPYAGQTNFSTLGSASSATASIFGSNGNAYESVYINGGCAQAQNFSGPGTGGNTICIGSNAANNFPVKAEIFEILVWNRFLTPPEYMQAQMWACDKYAQAYPWASMTKFPVFFGDSITMGTGASNMLHSAPYLAAQTLGLSYGQWHNLGIGGVTLNNLGVLAPNWVDPVAAKIGKKVAVLTFEWFNQQDSTTTNGAAYLAARKAIANQQTVWGTSTSIAADPNAARAAYDSAWDAAHSLNIDSYIPIHTDTHIGVNGSYATYSTSTGGDGVHLTDTTYPYLATLFVNGFNALP